MFIKARTERLFVSSGKAENQAHSHSHSHSQAQAQAQSQTLMETQTQAQSRTQSTIFSLKKRAESFTSSMFPSEVSNSSIQLLCGTVLLFDPSLPRVMVLVDGKHVQCATQIISN